MVTDRQGLAVLVTRPEPQAAALAERLRALGAEPLVCPMLEIAGLPPPASLAEPVEALVFVSAAAVAHYAAALARLGLPLPSTTPAFAVGQATAQALSEAGFVRVLCPEGADETSEGLLALPAFRAAAAGRVLLVRGRGGRELVAEAVRAAGGRLFLAEVYERRRPARDWAAECARWQERGVAALLVTSGESLDNLLSAVPEQARSWLYGRLLVLPSARLAEQARAAGFLRIVTARGADDEAMMAGLDCLRRV